MRTFIPGILAGWASAAVFAFTFVPEEPACAIQLDKMNVFYMGFDNPVSIVVRGVPEQEVRIETSDNLTIQKYGNYHYNVRPSMVGEATITVSGGKLKPVTFKYRVKRIPDPAVRLGAMYRSGAIPNGAFRAQAGLAAVIENFDIDAKCEMVSYKVIHLRKGQLIAEVTNNGARYNPAVQAVIDAAMPGDTYIFDEIKVRCPGDAVPRAMEGLTVVIK